VSELELLAWSAELLHAFEQKGLVEPIIEYWSNDTGITMVRLHMTTASLNKGAFAKTTGPARDEVAVVVSSGFYFRLGRSPDTSGEAFSSMHLTAQVAAEDFANHGYPRRSP
jgi:hypothetical protein